MLQALEGRPITLHGDGLQTRSFCYVSDLVDGLLAAARAPALPTPVNLGNPDELSVLALAHAVMRLAGRDLEVVHEPRPADDPSRRCPDVAAARALLGFAPRVSLDEGLGLTLDDFRARLAAKPAQVAPDASPARSR